MLGLVAQNCGKNLENFQDTSSRPQSSHVLDQLWMFKDWGASCGIATQHQSSNMAYELKIGSRTVTAWTSPIIAGWKGTIISSLKNRCQYENVCIVAKQCLHDVKALPAPRPIPPVRKLGVHNRLRGDTVGTADPNWPNIPSYWAHTAGRRRKGRHLEW